MSNLKVIKCNPSDMGFDEDTIETFGVPGDIIEGYVVVDEDVIGSDEDGEYNGCSWIADSSWDCISAMCVTTLKEDRQKLIKEFNESVLDEYKDSSGKYINPEQCQSTSAMIIYSISDEEDIIVYIYMYDFTHIMCMICNINFINYIHVGGEVDDKDFIEMLEDYLFYHNDEELEKIDDGELEEGIIITRDLVTHWIKNYINNNKDINGFWKNQLHIIENGITDD